MTKKSKTIESYAQFLEKYMPTYYAQRPSAPALEPDPGEHDPDAISVRAASRFIISGKQDQVHGRAVPERRRSSRARATSV